MCGRLTFYDEVKLGQTYNVEFSVKPSFNAAPGIQHPILFFRKGNAIVEQMKWGLVPSWAKDPRVGFKMINARTETVAMRPAYRTPLRSQRCLIPANGFYEWSKEGKKQPYYITLKTSPAFMIAGLYDRWHDVEGKEIASFTIITTEANELIKKIHDRMPVILNDKEALEWVSADYSPSLLKLLKPYEPDQMNLWPVSELVNSPRNNTPDLIKAIKLGSQLNIK